MAVTPAAVRAFVDRVRARPNGSGADAGSRVAWVISALSVSANRVPGRRACR
jgi:hypothetical protein